MLRRGPSRLALLRLAACAAARRRDRVVGGGGARAGRAAACGRAWTAPTGPKASRSRVASKPRSRERRGGRPALDRGRAAARRGQAAVGIRHGRPGAGDRGRDGGRRRADCGLGRRAPVVNTVPCGRGWAATSRTTRSAPSCCATPGARAEVVAWAGAHHRPEALGRDRDPGRPCAGRWRRADGEPVARERAAAGAESIETGLAADTPRVPYQAGDLVLRASRRAAARFAPHAARAPAPLERLVEPARSGPPPAPPVTGSAPRACCCSRSWVGSAGRTRRRAGRRRGSTTGSTTPAATSRDASLGPGLHQTATYFDQLTRARAATPTCRRPRSRRIRRPASGSA